MRALLTGLLLVLAAPAAAAARPLDADRSFARAGIFRMDEPTASRAVIALPGGGTLHATDGAGILRLSARGARRASAFLEPAGVPLAMAAAPRGALVLGELPSEYGKPTPLGVWRVDRDGRTLGHHEIPLPGGESAGPVSVVRAGRAFALVRATRGEPYRTRMMIVALTPAGALDASWGNGGFRALGAGDAGLAISPRDGSLVVAEALQTRCDRHGYSGRSERARLRVTRLSRDGTRRRWTRTTTIGGADECPLAEVGDVIDEGARLIVAGAFGRSTVLLGLRANGRRHPRFGRRGVLGLRADAYWTATQVVRRRGGYAFAYTEGDGAPFAVAGLIDRSGRNLRRRRLKVTRNYPSSAVHDIAIDRGGIVAAGRLHDTDLFIREDYGQAHLAVWRVKTR